nr:hypothetical protein [Escherichia albertii]
MVRHRLSLLAQQVPVVQAGVRIVNQNARKKQNPPNLPLQLQSGIGKGFPFFAWRITPSTHTE